MDDILQDIRKANKMDSTSSPETPVATQMKAAIEEEGPGSQRQNAGEAACHPVGYAGH